MGASQVQIANRVAIKLGADRITSINDNVKLARVVTELWDTCRQTELSKRYWNFALSRAVLPALSQGPAFQFGNAYQLPSDFLTPVQIGDYYCIPNFTDYNGSDDSPYAIEGTQIFTDFGAPLHLRYVSDITNPGLFHPLFVEVLACKIAFEGCYAITQSRQGQEVAMNDYKLAVKDAALMNAVAKPPQGIPDDAWMFGRL